MRNRRTALVQLIVIVVVTTWLGMHQLRLETDVENESLKSIGTSEARDLERMNGAFGSDHSILLGFHAAPGVALSEQDLEQIAETIDTLPQMAGVRAVGPIERPDDEIAIASVYLRRGDAGTDLGTAATRAAEQVREACYPLLIVHATGRPLIEAAIARGVETERSWIVPCIGAVLLVLLWLTYRRLRAGIIVLAPALVGIVWTGGLAQLLGHRLSPVLVLLDPLLLTVGVAASVHLAESFRRLDQRSADAVRRELWRPMLLTTITSMVGFLSLLLSPIPAVQTFGTFASFGIALTSCLAIWLVPTWLRAFTPDLGGGVPRDSLLDPYTRWLRPNAGRVLVVSAVLAAVFVTHSAHVRVDNEPAKILPADSVVRQETDWMVDRMGGVEPFAIYARGSDSTTDPELLCILAADLRSRSGVTRLAGPPLRAANGDTMIRALLRPGGSQARETLFDQIDRFLVDLGHPEFRTVGTAVQIARDSGNLIRSQLLGLMLVVPLLGISVAIGLGSWKLGLLSLLPNALPCLFLYGAMAMFDHSLSVATVMIGSVMIGLIVDDTIHLLHAYRSARVRGEDPHDSVTNALRLTARPITITSVVLFAGLAVGTFGTLNTTTEFSLLAASTIPLAWVLDLFVLPAMLVCRPRRASMEPRPAVELAT